MNVFNPNSKSPVKVLICSGYFESALPSYREYAYSKGLSALGYDVTLMCGDQSQIWKGSRVKLAETDPTTYDHLFARTTGVRLLRRKAFFRYSDFILYWPLISAVRAADIVHVIEFRQGITAFVALLARFFKKPVVYDHEQRGDRTAKWYSRVDSLFRRLLIAAGSLTVSGMRHTVLANRDHFRSCSLKETDEIFAPLGADPSNFYFDDAERARLREKWGVGLNEKCAVMTGKLHGYKLIPSVIRACRSAGLRLFLVGTLSPDVAAEVSALQHTTVTVIPAVNANELREVYNAADMAVFTTFSLSYWEAILTGIPLVIPGTEFSRLALAGEQNVFFFGDSDMFQIPDEQYRNDVDIVPDLTDALTRVDGRTHVPNLKYASSKQVSGLADYYQDLLSRAKGRPHTQARV